MKYQVGDRVKLNVDYTTSAGTFDKGSKGTVNVVYPILQAYLVEFDEYVNRARVPEECLDPA